MANEYYVIGIVIFLFVLQRYSVSVKKYIDTAKSPAFGLRESIEDFLCKISPLEVIEDDDLVQLEEMRDMIESYVIRNPKIFSNLLIKDE